MTNLRKEEPGLRRKTEALAFYSEKKGDGVMSEAEEAVRLMIVLGQLLIPGAREIARLLAKGTEEVVKASAHGVSVMATRVRDSYEKTLDNKDAAGVRGWVNEKDLNGPDLMMVDMPEALNREDLSMLGKACSKLGVRFSIAELGGESRLIFEAKDAASIKSATDTILSEYRISGDEAAELNIAEDPQTAFTRNGMEFEQKTPGTFEAKGPNNTVVQATKDGKWSILDHAGNVVLESNGNPLEGRVMPDSKTPLIDAADWGTSYVKTITNKKLMAANRKAGYETPERVNKSVSAEKVRMSVHSAAQRNPSHARVQRRAQSRNKKLVQH